VIVEDRVRCSLLGGVGSSCVLSTTRRAEGYCCIEARQRPGRKSSLLKPVRRGGLASIAGRCATHVTSRGDGAMYGSLLGTLGGGNGERISHPGARCNTALGGGERLQGNDKERLVTRRKQEGPGIEQSLINVTCDESLRQGSLQLRHEKK